MSTVGVMSFMSLQVTPRYQGKFLAASSCEVVFDRPDAPDRTDTRSAVAPPPPSSTSEVTWKAEPRLTADILRSPLLCLYLLAALFTPSILRTWPSSTVIVRTEPWDGCTWKVKVQKWAEDWKSSDFSNIATIVYYRIFFVMWSKCLDRYLFLDLVGMIDRLKLPYFL